MSKFCKDCKHCAIPDLGAYWARCLHPKALMAPDTTTGKQDQRYCDAMRWSTSPCGDDATLFEPHIAEERAA
jgi:hypothetical protein